MPGLDLSTACSYNGFEPVGRNLANDAELREQRKNSKALGFDRVRVQQLCVRKQQQPFSAVPRVFMSPCSAFRCVSTVLIVSFVSLTNAVATLPFTAFC